MCQTRIGNNDVYGKCGQYCTNTVIRTLVEVPRDIWFGKLMHLVERWAKILIKHFIQSKMLNKSKG